MDKERTIYYTLDFTNNSKLSSLRLFNVDIKHFIFPTENVTHLEQSFLQNSDEKTYELLSSCERLLTLFIDYFPGRDEPPFISKSLHTIAIHNFDSLEVTVEILNKHKNSLTTLHLHLHLGRISELLMHPLLDLPNPLSAHLINTYIPIQKWLTID